MLAFQINFDIFVNIDFEHVFENVDAHRTSRQSVALAIPRGRTFRADVDATRGMLAK